VSGDNNLTWGKVQKNVDISAITTKYLKEKNACQVKTEEHVGGMPGHARHRHE
jgi:hypothetical protein